jgi:hypothetical protein
VFVKKIHQPTGYKTNDDKAIPAGGMSQVNKGLYEWKQPYQPSI